MNRGEQLLKFLNSDLLLLASFPYLCRPFTNSGCGDLLVVPVLGGTGLKLRAVLPVHISK